MPSSAAINTRKRKSPEEIVLKLSEIEKSRMIPALFHHYLLISVYIDNFALNSTDEVVALKFQTDSSSTKTKRKAPDASKMKVTVSQLKHNKLNKITYIAYVSEI